MHMYMIAELLIPGMEDLDDPGGCPEIFGVSRKLDQGFPHAPVQEFVHVLFVCGNKRVQFMGESPNDVEIRGVDQFPFPFFKPGGFLHSLAGRAVPVAAGSRDDLYISAF